MTGVAERVKCPVALVRAFGLEEVGQFVARTPQAISSVACLITSDRNATLATLAAWVRSHWEIETAFTGYET